MLYFKNIVLVMLLALNYEYFPKIKTLYPVCDGAFCKHSLCYGRVK